MFSRDALIRLIVPLIIEQLLLMTVGMADTVMVTTAGEATVSGVSLVDNINTLIIQIFSALSTGGAVVVAQYLGRQETHSAKTAAKQLLYAMTGISAVLMILALGGERTEALYIGAGLGWGVAVAVYALSSFWASLREWRHAGP